MSEIIFNPGDRIKVIAGKQAGRVGEYLKSYSSVFPDYCRVKLDLKGRERDNKILMIKKVEVDHE